MSGVRDTFRLILRSHGVPDVASREVLIAVEALFNALAMERLNNSAEDLNDSRFRYQAARGTGKNVGDVIHAPSEVASITRCGIFIDPWWSKSHVRPVEDLRGDLGPDYPCRRCVR